MMKNQYVMAIINSTRIGVPLIYKEDTIMVHRRKTYYRVITAYYANLTETEIYKMIIPFAKTVQIYGHYGSTSLTATLDAHELDMLISQVDKMGELSRL